ncbi:sulfotransferase domain-containing protein, partial [Candidatus Bipolaricaulota bacterium]|nr:sulfotransferase domain-containing protein [Candidatus Bipolaricaulota bacterium]
SRKHLQQMEKWLSEQPHIDVLYVRYNDVLTDPRAQATRVSRFLDDCVDPERMASAVDKRLYRQRA